MAEVCLLFIGCFLLFLAGLNHVGARSEEQEQDLIQTHAISLDIRQIPDPRSIIGSTGLHGKVFQQEY